MFMRMEQYSEFPLAVSFPLCCILIYLLPSTPILGTASVVATDTLSLFLITCRYVAGSEVGALTPLHGGEILIMAIC